jgi:alpha-L-fucosidase
MTRQKNGTTYFVYLPEKGETGMPAEVRVTSHQPAPGAAVTLLGSPAKLVWRAEGDGFVVTIPDAVRTAPPCQHAWTIRVTAIKP